jgi:hypothetical protein
MDTSTLPVVEGAKFSEPRALRFANGFTMAAAFVAWAGLSTSAAAQTHTWTLRDEIPARVRSAAAYDPARGRVVLMGGIGDGPMIEWDGVDWEIVPVAVPPLSQVGNSVAYDEARGQSVFMTNGSMLLWDGHALQTYAGALPTAVTDAAMAYDPVRQRVVLFGGGNAVTYFNETWEWDGVSWSRRLPANSPPARVRLAMSWDPVRQEVMVYGGEDRLGQLLSDQWFWNGTNWTQVVTSPRPPANRTRAMAADLARQRVVLCAGTAPGLDTWEWNGSAWSLVVTANRPRADRDVSCVYAGMNGKVMLAFGTASYVATETWLYDGVDWALADARPHSNGLLRTVADTARGCVVSYDSGFYMPWRTFEWNGVHWHARPTAHQPDAASAFDVAYDPVRQRVLLFGGEVLLAGSQPGPVLDALAAPAGLRRRPRPGCHVRGALGRCRYQRDMVVGRHDLAAGAADGESARPPLAYDGLRRRTSADGDLRRPWSVRAHGHLGMGRRQLGLCPDPRSRDVLSVSHVYVRPAIGPGRSGRRHAGLVVRRDFLDQRGAAACASGRCGLRRENRGTRRTR